MASRQWNSAVSTGT